MEGGYQLAQLAPRPFCICGSRSGIRLVSKTGQRGSIPRPPASDLALVQSSALLVSTPYFQVEAVERSFRELVLRLTVISTNPDGFYIDRNFAVQLALNAAIDSPLTRDVARQLGSEGNLHDAPDDFDAMEKALGTIAYQYVEQVEILATDKLHPTARKLETGTIRWEDRDDDQLDSTATYRLLFTKAQWIDHIKVGDSWDSIAYDISNWEESERDYGVEVLERDGTKIVLRAKRILEHEEDLAPASARFVLGVLIERAEATRTLFGDSVPIVDIFKDDAMIAAAQEHIKSVACRETDGDTVTLEAVVTDPAMIEKFEPGMRWAAFGTH